MASFIVRVDLNNLTDSVMRLFRLTPRKGLINEFLITDVYLHGVTEYCLFSHIFLNYVIF